MIITGNTNDCRDDHDCHVVTLRPAISVSSDTSQLSSSLDQNITQAVVGSSLSTSDQDSGSLAGPSYSEDLSAVSTDKSYVTVTDIYEMFPNFSNKAIDMVHHLTSMNGALTINALLDISGEDSLFIAATESKWDTREIESR